MLGLRLVMWISALLWILVEAVFLILNLAFSLFLLHNKREKGKIKQINDEHGATARNKRR